MSLSVTPFQFHTHAVRVIVRDGEPWLVLQDVMNALNYSKSSTPHKVIAHVPAEWKGKNPIPTLGGTQQLLTISEQGLYFFLGRSDKPKALPFQKWLAGEVLPSIRKTGSYGTPEPLTIDPTPKRLRELTSAVADWSYRVRKRLEQAGIEPEPFPAKIMTEGDLATALAGNILRAHRWLLTLDHDMRLSLSLVPENAYVMTAEQFAAAVSSGSDLSDALLAKIITGATKQLAWRAAYSRLKTEGISASDANRMASEELAA